MSASELHQFMTDHWPPLAVVAAFLAAIVILNVTYRRHRAKLGAKERLADDKQAKIDLQTW